MYSIYEDIFERSTDGMSIIIDGKFVECNKAFIEILGCELKEDVLKLHPSDISPEFQPDGISSFKKANEKISYALEYGNITFEWLHIRADGDPFWVEVVLTDISIENKQKVLVIWRDIGEKKKIESDLDVFYYRSTHDMLTGLSNRLLFQDRAKHALYRAKRENTKLSLFFIDLDHFKEINDTLGHEYGDEVLKSVAKRVNQVIRDQDTFSRQGGDEFTLLVEDVKSIEDISYLAQKII